MTKPESNNLRVGLCLSGGGVRSIAFHTGVLKCLAEKGLFEKIEYLSTVSGGSLLVGLIFQLSNYTWPTSQTFSEKIIPQIRYLITEKSVQNDAICRLILNPLNWRFLLSRANVLARSIEKLWNISAYLEKLPSRPVWSLNGTTAENGRRFRIKGQIIGDYEIGYATANDIKISEAMALSAAFPGGVGPLRIRASKYEWHKKENWNSKKPEEVIPCVYKDLHLYDGGVYDNLGTEPFFDIGRQSLKTHAELNINFLIVSDASSPYSRDKIPGPLNPCRLIKISNIFLDQIRALRVRSFITFLVKNPSKGLYLQIGSNAVDCMSKYATNSEELINSYEWLSKKFVDNAAAYKTTLNKMNRTDFDVIFRNGYETGLWNYLVWFDKNPFLSLV